MLLKKLKSLFKKEKSEKKSKEITGVINYLNNRKGYGFIESPAKDRSIFVHFNDCIEQIQKGAYVKFLIEETEKGLRAKQVQLLNS